jgi:hypothetical protein
MRERLKAGAKRLIKRQLLAGRFPARSFSFGRTRSGDAAVVVMCLWNRPSRLIDILDLLDAQESTSGVRLYLWNNSRADHAGHLATLRRYSPRGALVGVDIVRSPFNLGAIARFYWARHLVLRGYTGPVIVLDDDENVTPQFVATALEHYRPDTLTAWWAFSVGDGGYWDREHAVPGGRVDYAGTGGMVCNSAIFGDSAFFTGIPEKFWMLDDMWLNHFAGLKGYGLAKLPVEIEFVMHDTNQFHTQIYLKEEFHEYLSS